VHEECIYDMWSKLEDRYAHFVQSQEKDALIVELSKDEDQLYSEGEDVTRSAHATRLEAGSLEIPLRRAGVKLKNDRRLRLICARRLIGIPRKQLRKKSGSRASMRRINS
jgi:hypothetical protein